MIFTIRVVSTSHISLVGFILLKFVIYLRHGFNMVSPSSIP